MINKYLLGVVCLCLHISLFSQKDTLADLSESSERDTFITILEEYQNGKLRKLKDDAPAIVDMGSILRIRLNKRMIEREMFMLQGISRNDQRLEQLEEINHLLEHYIQIVSLVNQVLLDEEKASLQLINRIADLQIAFLEEIQQNLELYETINDLLLDEYPDVAESKEGKYPESIFILEKLEEKAEKLRNSIISDTRSLRGKDSAKQLYFRLGAFIKNREGGRPVHVENFDTYSREEFDPVLRFKTPVSDEEKEAIKENQLLSNQFSAGFSTTLNQVRRLLTSEFNEIFTSLDKYRKFKTRYSNALQLFRDSTEAQDAFHILNSNFGSLERIGRFINIASNTLSSFGVSLTSNNFNSKLPNNTLNRLDTTIGSTFGAFEKQVNEILNTQGSDFAGADSLQAVLGDYDLFKQSLRQDIQKVHAIVGDIRTMLNPFKKISLNNEFFSDQVSRFAVDELPKEGYIELNYIVGKRPGNQILIKAELEFGEGGKIHPLYRRYINLQRTQIHVRMAGSLILANPYNRDDNPDIDLESKYQFAPTYGIFLKWGSRKSQFYNDFLNFGLGLAFSSPDFNTDGTPEFGAGFILTGFKDLLNAGWGYNFGTDSPYTFIGFNIPFSVGGLSNLATTTSIAR